VIWIQMTLNGAEQDWSVFYAGGTDSALTGVAQLLSPGVPGFDLDSELDVRGSDTVLVKNRFSAFFPGASAILSVLRANGIQSLFVAGTMTNICCESTARDAMMHNFKVIMLADGTATISDIEHNAALANILRAFGDVLTVDEAIMSLKPQVAD
jgi:ureidoacrylate peracid hydrolase